MKLKYYIRGLGIGILITTIVLSFGGKKEKLSDKEIIARARELGMIMKEDNDDELKKVLEKSSDKDASGQNATENKNADAEKEADEKDIEDAPEPSNGASHSDDGIEDFESANDNTADIDIEDTQDNTNPDPNADDIQSSDEGSGAGDNVDTSEQINNDTDTDINTGDTQTNDVALDADSDKTELPSDTNAIDADADSTEQISEDGEPSTEIQDQITFTIVRGMSSRQVSELLAEKGLVEDAVDFDDYIKRQGKASVIRVGTYTLTKNADYKAILKAITG